VEPNQQSFKPIDVLDGLQSGGRRRIDLAEPHSGQHGQKPTKLDEPTLLKSLLAALPEDLLIRCRFLHRSHSFR
jgi:hypothetical protein